jgi:putative transposase
LWKYSSYNAFISEKQTLLQRESVLEWFGGKDEYLLAHEQMVSELDSIIFEDDK